MGCVIMSWSHLRQGLRTIDKHRYKPQRAQRLSGMDILVRMVGCAKLATDRDVHATFIEKSKETKYT